jgi:nitroreductase
VLQEWRFPNTGSFGYREKDSATKIEVTDFNSEEQNHALLGAHIPPGGINRRDFRLYWRRDRGSRHRKTAVRCFSRAVPHFFDSSSGKARPEILELNEMT